MTNSKIKKGSILRKLTRQDRYFKVVSVSRFTVKATLHDNETGDKLSKKTFEIDFEQIENGNYSLEK